MNTFAAQRRADQESWRRSNLANLPPGRQNGREYLHILPRRDWELGLYPPLRSTGSDPLATYLRDERIKPHTGIHNLCSSWVLCANLYFPFRDAQGRQVLASFLRGHLAKEIVSCERLHLEYEHSDPSLRPSQLLGEDAGGRGAGQTSPDLAFEVTTARGPGLILVESKFTEHWFYECSAHKPSSQGRQPNYDRTRCGRFAEMVDSRATTCHAQQSWGRRYWEHLLPSINPDALEEVGYCPAAKGAYQLLRQQALAEALARSGRFQIVLSAVAYDEENADLFQLRGEHATRDLRLLWPRLFKGQSTFASFSHQTWVNHVRATSADCYSGWLKFVADRYGYGRSGDAM